MVEENKKAYFAHESTYIDEPCSIGAGTKIWHFSHIMQGSTIGKNCNIGQNVVISPQVVLGDGVRIQNNVSVYTGVCCEDGVFLGPSCVFTNVRTPRGFLNKKNEYLPTLVRQGAAIGANVTVVCGNTIGCYALVGAGAVVTHSVPDYALAQGTPARVVGYVCRCGERLHFRDEQATCAVCGMQYKKALTAVKAVSQPNLSLTCSVNHKSNRIGQRYR